MNYNYIASGGISVFGCAVDKLYYDPTWNSKFQKGQTVYFKNAALKGKLEKVFIYDINNFLVYQDPSHALYNERELVTYNEALALIFIYRERYNAVQESKAKNC